MDIGKYRCVKCRRSQWAAYSTLWRCEACAADVRTLVTPSRWNHINAVISLIRWNKKSVRSRCIKCTNSITFALPSRLEPCAGASLDVCSAAKGNSRG